jgi:hypothetical protein
LPCLWHVQTGNSSLWPVQNSNQQQLKRSCFLK